MLTINCCLSYLDLTLCVRAPPAKSLITSPAGMSPAAVGTKGLLPGICHRCGTVFEPYKPTILLVRCCPILYYIEFFAQEITDKYFVSNGRLYQINLLYCFLTFWGTLSIMNNTTPFFKCDEGESTPEPTAQRAPVAEKGQAGDGGTWLRSGAPERFGLSGCDGSARSSGGRCQTSMRSRTSGIKRSGTTGIPLVFYVNRGRAFYFAATETRRRFP